LAQNPKKHPKTSKIVKNGQKTRFSAYGVFFGSYVLISWEKTRRQLEIYFFNFFQNFFKLFKNFSKKFQKFFKKIDFLC